MAGDLSLNIHQAKESNVFEVSFDFGILKGVMIISAEKNALLALFSTDKKLLNRLIKFVPSLKTRTILEVIGISRFFSI